MRKSTIKVATCITGLLISGVLNAAIVKFTINGQLDHMIDRDYYYQTDLYNLDGANYIREMIIDTSIPPDLFFSGETTMWRYNSAFLVSNTYSITNRPNGAPDIFIDGSIVGSIMSVQNAYSVNNNAYYDAVTLGSSQLTGELGNLYASDEWIYLGNFIPGNSGYVTEPPYPFDASDVLSINANVWNYAPNGQTGDIDGKYLQYDQINLSAYASVVPIPATVWLFGTGLLGLISVAKRKQKHLFN